MRFAVFMPICCGFSVLEPPYNRPPLERETKSAADDDVLPILNISAEMEE